MQFGIFTVGDVTHRPHDGPYADRARADQGHRRDRQEGRGGRARRLRDRASTTTRRSSPSAPTTTLAFIAAQTERILLSTSTTLITTNDPVRIAEDYADAAAPRRRPRRPDDGPRQHRPGLPVVRQGHPRRHPARDRELRAAAPAVARGRRQLGGQVPHAAPGLHRRRRARSTAYRRSSGTARSAAPRSPSRPPTTATASSPTTSSGRPATPSRWSRSTAAGSSTTATAPPTRPSSASAGRSSCARTARTPCASSGPTSTTRRSTATARRWRTSRRQTPLTVGSPAAGHRADARLPRVRRRLPAPAVPHRPRRAPAQDGARAARHPRRGGRARCCARSSPPSSRPTCPTPRPTRAGSPPRPRTAASTVRHPGGDEVTPVPHRRRHGRRDPAVLDAPARRPPHRRDRPGARAPRRSSSRWSTSATSRTT